MNIKLTKNIGLLATLLLAGSLASCGSEGGEGGGTPDVKELSLTVSGPSKQHEWLAARLADFNSKRDSASQVKFEVVDYEENKVDSDVPDWKKGPDVYAFAGDKIKDLYTNGCLADLDADTLAEYKETIGTDVMDTYAKHVKYVGYPYAADNGYYLYYDKSVLNETDVQTLEGILAKCDADHMLSYDINVAYYGFGALMSFGNRYQVTFNRGGGISNVEADFDNENAVKAAKMLIQLSELENTKFTSAQVAPIPANKAIATVDGSWNHAAYKKSMGDNFACTKLPTVTIGDETKNISSFLGYKLYGVNPQRSVGDKERLLLAKEVAKYLTSSEVQLSRYNEFNVMPTLKALQATETIQADANFKAIKAQSEFAVAQTAVPGKVWSAPTDFMTTVKGWIKEGRSLKGETAETEITDEMIHTELVIMNDAIKSSR